MSSITFKRDILNEVCLKTNQPKDKVEVLFNSLFKYITHIATETDYTAIRLPHIGTLYSKDLGIRRKMQKMHRKKAISGWSELDEIKYKRFKTKLNQIYTLVSDCVNNYQKTGIVKEIRHIKIERITNPWFTGKMTIEEIELLQNQCALENEK